MIGDALHVVWFLLWYAALNIAYGLAALFLRLLQWIATQEHNAIANE